MAGRKRCESYAAVLYTKSGGTSVNMPTVASDLSVCRSFLLWTIVVVWYIPQNNFSYLYALAIYILMHWKNPKSLKLV